MHKRIMMLLAIVMTLLMATMSVAAVSANHDNDGATHDFANPDFEATWNRTDLPVETDEVDRTWIWGPAYTDGMMEPYAESPNDMREVQYFDKSRMEINDPDAVNDGLWYVTNGLLVVEMVEGWYQTGDDTFDNSPDPAEVNIIGDPGDESGLSPTYADINTFGLRDLPARADGSVITATIDTDGNIGTDDTKAALNVTSAHRVQVPEIDHQVASVFWDFMNSTGTVYEDGQYVDEKLFENPYYATGLPITEAYWSSAMVNGSERDVLWQCFERRCLTYTPGNPDGFLVEAGNVGQHYYRWQYGDDEPTPTTQEFEVQLGSLNRSGVSGTAMLSLTGNELTIELHAEGLEEGNHWWHLHGLGDGTDAVCPTDERDTNNNNYIELTEGLPAYGGVIRGLEDLVVDATGIVDDTFTLTLSDEELTKLGDLLNNVIVIHGLTADLNAEDEDDAIYEESLPVACGDINEPGFFDEATSFDVELGELNDSGVTGTAHFEQLGDLLTARLTLNGLEAGMHMMHIHGLETGDASCPTMDDDTNSNGYIELAEGLPAYGGVLVTLGTPTLDEDGGLVYASSYIVDPTVLGDLLTRTVVIHGMTADLDGSGDAYEELLPVACGDLDGDDEPPVDPPVEPDPDSWTSTLTSVNNSGATGTVDLALNGNQLTVSFTGTGLATFQTLSISLHGLESGAARCPTAADDTDSSGLVSVIEGLAVYGAVVLDTDAPAVDFEGNLTYESTLTVNPATLPDLSDLVIVVHGLRIDLDGDGPNVPVFFDQLPAACGAIVVDA